MRSQGLLSGNKRILLSFIATIAQSAGAVEYTDCIFAEG